MKFSQFVIAALLAISASVQAQDSYPNKPINFIVPYAAGGGADSRSRQMAQKMSVILKQSIIVDNKLTILSKTMLASWSPKVPPVLEVESLARLHCSRGDIYR